MRLGSQFANVSGLRDHVLVCPQSGHQNERTALETNVRFEDAAQNINKVGYGPKEIRKISLSHEMAQRGKGPGADA